MPISLDMEPVVAIQKMTVGEFRELEFDDNDMSWYELINGELVKRSSPSPRHQKISFHVSRIIGNYVVEKKIGEVYCAPIDVFLGGYNAIQPDLLFIPTDRLAIITANGIEGAPALVVEIVSPTSGYRDRVTKKNLYEQYGIQEYWVVDPLEELIEIFVLENGQYTLLSAASPNEGRLTSAILTGLVVNVAEVLR